MSNFYDRHWELGIDGRTIVEAGQIVQLKCVFNILHDFNGGNSYADISLFNLKKDTAQNLFREGLQLSFKAGYVGNTDLIFLGRTRNIFKERVGGDVITRILARGGSQQPQEITIEPRVNDRVPRILRDIANQAGYSIELNDSQFSDVPAYASGYPYTGTPEALLRKLSYAHKFGFVFENDNLVIVRDTYFRNGVHIVSESSGMQGIPEITEVGCDVTSRINPRIKMGSRINIQSEFKTFNFGNLYFQDIEPNAGSGLYVVKRLQYSGDNYGDDWTVKITGNR